MNETKLRQILDLMCLTDYQIINHSPESLQLQCSLKNFTFLNYDGHQIPIYTDQRYWFKYHHNNYIIAVDDGRPITELDFIQLEPNQTDLDWQNLFNLLYHEY